MVGSILIFTTMVGSRTILEKMKSLWVSFHSLLLGRELKELSLVLFCSQSSISTIFNMLIYQLLFSKTQQVILRDKHCFSCFESVSTKRDNLLCLSLNIV